MTSTGDSTTVKGNVLCYFFRTTAHGYPNVGRVKPFTHPEVSDTDFCIPHIKDKPSLGIALSGGGFRGATCAAGWVRGLHMIHLPDGSIALSQVQYLSSTSGGSWFNAAFSYKAPVDHKQLPLDDFFERYIEPVNLSLAELRQDYPKSSRSFEAAIAAHNALDTLLHKHHQCLLRPVGKFPALEDLPCTSDEDIEVRLPDRLRQQARRQQLLDFLLGDQEAGDEGKGLSKVPSWVKPWTAAVAKTFLKPYSLNIFHDSTISAASTIGDIANKRAAAAAAEVLLACTDQNRPFPILTGTGLRLPGKDGNSMYPIEFSPLYFGTPSSFAAKWDSKPALGGGYVEPWGLNAVPGKLCCKEDGITGTVVVARGASCHTVPLAQAVSISSSFLAGAARDSSTLAQELASTEELLNWGCLPNKSKRVTGPECHKTHFADGGSTDNLAVMPLLRRGVRCLILFVASATPPDDTWQRFANEKSEIAALFGAARVSGDSGVAVKKMNGMCHVFGQTQVEGEMLFRELFESLHSKLRAGKPGYHRTTYMVKENAFFHIPARAEPVEVLWIHNQQWNDWESSLPPETLNKLLEDRRGTSGGGKGVHHKSVMERQNFHSMQESHEGFGTQDTLYRFPYFTTCSYDYSSAAVKMLSQMSTAVLLQPDVKQHITDLVYRAQKLHPAGKTELEEPSPMMRHSITWLDDASTVLPGCYYTSEADAVPSAADMVACLKEQRPQLVLIKEQHCQAEGLQESMAEAGYFEVLTAGTQGSIFATADMLSGLEDAISGQASSFQQHASGSCDKSSSSSSSALKSQQAHWRHGFGMQLSWWQGGTGQGSGNDVARLDGGSGSGGGSGGQGGTSQPPQDAGGSSSGGDKASSSTRDNAAAALEAAHAACSSVNCGSLKLQLLKTACAGTYGQGAASCISALDGDTVLQVLKFRSVLSEDSAVLTKSAAWKLSGWPRQHVAPPSAQLSGEHGFKVELALSMCRHDTQLCLKLHQAHAEHTIENAAQRSAVHCLGLPLLRSSFALVACSGGEDADDRLPHHDSGSYTPIMYLKNSNISGPLCVEEATPTQSKSKLEKYWLHGFEPKLTIGQKNVSIEAGMKAQQHLADTKPKVEANVAQQLVMLHPAAPKPVYLDTTACGRANMELRRGLLKSVLCSEVQDQLCCLDYNPMLQASMPLLTYIADLGEDFSNKVAAGSSSLQLHVDVCLPSVMVQVKNPRALDVQRIFGVDMDAGVFLLEGRCHLKVGLK